MQAFLQNPSINRSLTNCKTAHNNPTTNTSKTSRGTMRLAQLPKNIQSLPLSGSYKTRGSPCKVFPLFGMGKRESWSQLSLRQQRDLFSSKHRTLHPEIWIVPLSHISWVAGNKLHQFPTVLPSHILTQGGCKAQWITWVSEKHKRAQLPSVFTREITMQLIVRFNKRCRIWNFKYFRNVHSSYWGNTHYIASKKPQVLMREKLELDLQQAEI